jgi:hypothetical protein
MQVDWLWESTVFCGKWGFALCFRRGRAWFAQALGLFAHVTDWIDVNAVDRRGLRHSDPQIVHFVQDDTVMRI